MTDEPSTKNTQRSWLERLSYALSREPQDREQLLEILHDAQERNLLDAQALVMIEGVLQVSDMRVRDIMIPRPQMVVIEKNMTLQQIIPMVNDSAHSRFPVIGETRDEIFGIILAKDLLRYFFKKEENIFNVEDILRPAVFVPESKRLDILLREFRNSHNHMAIVLDEYGGVAGLITIEDVLEEIVGEIEDEHDIEEEHIKQVSENTYVVHAVTPVEDFNEYFKTHFSDEEFDTIGGLVIHEFGRLPKRGEKIKLRNLIITILHADSRRIKLLQVKVS